MGTYQLITRVILIIGLVVMVTTPDEHVSMWFRLHLSASQFLFGMAVGLSLGRWLYWKLEAH